LYFADELLAWTLGWESSVGGIFSYPAELYQPKDQSWKALQETKTVGTGYGPGSPTTHLAVGRYILEGMFFF
jgi:hypothetical protein